MSMPKKKRNYACFCFQKKVFFLPSANFTVYLPFISMESKCGFPDPIQCFGSVGSKKKSRVGSALRDAALFSGFGPVTRDLDESQGLTQKKLLHPYRLLMNIQHLICEFQFASSRTMVGRDSLIKRRKVLFWRVNFLSNLFCFWRQAYMPEIVPLISLFYNFNCV